ncbi:uncharacterized protein LOC126678762 [Mercurialis annua]|uniref:uncharacterized protein LOC126678762 n=1 Tax=Mercurialis annua TaxID=3986 RepID=UPI00216092BA|nr:uncharacterized protein LOC126678762 [Mercurialis annua]
MNAVEVGEIVRDHNSQLPHAEISSQVPHSISVSDGYDHETHTTHVDNQPFHSSPVDGISLRSPTVRGLYKGVDLDKLTNDKKDKLTVFIPPGKYFSPIGKHERKLASWLGYCARSVGPPIESWRNIEKTKGLLLFKMVKDYFDVSPESPAKWKKLEEKGDVRPDTPEMKQEKFEMYCFYKMGILYRKWKHKLHVKYMMYTNDEDRLKNIPQGLSSGGWKSMFNVFRQQEFLETSKKNSFNRSRQRIVASTGPTPFVQVEYDMMDEEIGVPPISEVWMATHTFVNENGAQDFHDPESSRIYEEMQRIENQPRNDDEPVPNPDDVLEEVCGTKSDYVRGRGLGYKARKKGMAIATASNDEVVELRRCVAEMTTRIQLQEQLHKEFLERLDSMHNGFQFSNSQVDSDKA